MKEICWIAGYPRSGTHKLRQTVWCLIHQRPFDYPNGYEWLLKNGYPFAHSMGNLFNGKAIYIIRNEEDVLRSFGKFFKKDCKDARKPVIEGVWEEAPPKLAEMYARWGTREANINSYINRPDTLIVHYEENEQQQIKNIADFLGLDPIPEIESWNQFEYLRYNDLLVLRDNQHKSMVRYEEWTKK